MDSFPDMGSPNSGNSSVHTENLASSSAGTSSPGTSRLSRYENQKRRDWNTFGQYQKQTMKNHLMVGLILGLLVNFHCAATFAHLNSVIGSAAVAIGEQPLSKIAIHKAKLALQDSASIKATPIVLGIRASLGGAPSLLHPLEQNLADYARAKLRPSGTFTTQTVGPLSGSQRLKGT
ncbi:ALOG domain-containing protein [Abeliophyllum distichum]|uniref:ALOG domain-containing protein n=1 Tax=Abeliophyllum distichum TaxID=126358 RepID=A0ABD1NSG5_9LAMI